MAEIFDFGLQQHKIKMDGKFFESNLFAVAGDTGRRLEVQLLDSNNMVQNTTGISLRLNANVAGQATYAEATLVDATKGLYELDLPNGMLIAPGNWQFQWQIIGTSGEKLHSFAFTGSIGSNLSEGGSEATNFYLNVDDLKQMQEDLVNGTFNSEALETNIAGKLEALEETYAPRLTEVNAQLADKASKQELNALGQLKFSGVYNSLTDLQNAYPTGSEGVFLNLSDGYTYRWDGINWTQAVKFQSDGIGDNTVTERKTTFIDVSKNLINTDNLTVGFFDLSNGEINPLASYRYTENYIPTNNELKLTFQPNDGSVVSIVFYDANQSYLSGATNDGLTTVTSFDIPQGAYYFRISFRDYVINSFMVEYGAYKSSYEAYRIPKIKTSLLPEGLTSEKEISVHFGDSITGAFTEVDRDYPHLISQKTNLETYNVGFGGARMGQHPTPKYDAFCMYRIADAIVSGDWTLQDADTKGHETYPQRLATLKGIDFNTVSYITIAYGTNDWSGGHTPNLPVDNPNDPFDVTNYYGATRYALKTIQEAYPHLKIILVSPYYRYDTASGEDADDGWRPLYNPNHHLIEYVDALEKVGDEFKTPSLDMWRELGINKYNREHYFDGDDGTHPNANGMDLIASRIAGQFKALYGFN